MNKSFFRLPTADSPMTENNNDIWSAVAAVLYIGITALMVAFIVTCLMTA